MARVEFERCDLPITITRAAGDDRAGAVTLRLGAREPRDIITLSTLTPGAEPVSVDGVVRLFQHPPPQAFVWSSPRNAARVDSVFRFTLDVSDPYLASMDWEGILRRAASVIGAANTSLSYPPEWTIVRRSHVRPRSETLALTLPIRLLQVNPRPEHPLTEWIRGMFGTRPNAEVERAVVTAAGVNWSAPALWPTVDVLHIDSLPTFADADALFSTSHPEQEGTLGWFARSTERWQTRLVVLHCESPGEARTARRFAHALIDKGGPALLVVPCPPRADGTSLVSAFYQSFYAQLIHDNPLDRAMAVATVAGFYPPPALFAGAGREDGLRPSNVGMSLMDVWSRLSAGPDSPSAMEIRDLARAHPTPDAAVAGLTVDLRDTRRKWDKLEFDQHERDGLLPLANQLHQLRSRILPPTPPGYVRSRLRAAAAAPAPGPRFVNGSLWSEVDRRLEQLPQDSALLRTGEIYHLGLDIGPKDAGVLTLNAAALFEDVFKWADADGVWVEFALTGIDFEVIGDPVREVWLPREGVTEPVYFAIRAKNVGVAHLRYGLYYQHNLIQSFHLVALVSYPGDLMSPAAISMAADLARALDVDADTIGDARYVARLEYSRTSELDRISEKTPRALSLAVNHVDDGRGVITIKGPDHFSKRVGVDVDAEMRDIVTQIRTTLNEISYAKAPGGSEPQYQFGPYIAASALDDRFDKAIVKLASAGYRLFNNLEPDDEGQRKLAELLRGERKVIQVAPLLRTKVVPWAFVYDRPFDAQPTLVGGRVAAGGVCRAPLLSALPTAGGVGAPADAGAPPPVPLAVTECGKHETCLLNPQRQAERVQNGSAVYDERSVACPFRFWGFRHVIEVPPQQVEGRGSTAHEETTRIAAGGGLQLVAGLNETLGSCEEHWKELRSLSSWTGPEYDRAHLLARLQGEDIAFIYFFCHARGGEADPGTNPPYLEFQKKGEPVGTIEPKDLAHQVKWKHGPLVFLNACGTIGYSPDALSPFLKTLVDGRHAAGVLGTEVPVAEILAVDVAHLFIERFVKGVQAGHAVLDVRRQLLNNKNPLGLVYTLFAPAELAIIL